MSRLLYLVLLPFLASVQCKLYTDPSQLRTSSYDFVIVGAGTAGSVLANRLTENKKFSVLVIEAGISDEASLATEVPGLAPSLAPNTIFTWNYTTTGQKGLQGRALAYPRGRVLGGTSTINFQFWTRGSEDDYDRYANVTGDNGWSWDRMLPYMKKSETLVTPNGQHDTTGEVNPQLHGTSGPVQVSLPGYPTATDQLVLAASEELSDDFPFNVDMNSGKPLGLGWTSSSTTTAGRRSSASTAYLQPVLSRSNLDVLINTQVTKLVPNYQSHQSPSFNTVQMAVNASSQRYVVNATKEVILSAGAIGSPQILQLSGIGDPKRLSSVGVKPLVTLSDVGQKLADHPLLANHWLVNSTNTLETISRNSTLAQELVTLWAVNSTGPLVDSGAEQLAWARVPTDGFIDPSAGPTSPHYEFLLVNGFLSFIEQTPSDGYYFSIITSVASPASRGSVTLASSNPFKSPIINPGLLSDPVDVTIMAESVKAAKKFANASAWDGYIIKPTDDLANVNTDDEILAYVRNYTSSVFHPSGTARMAPTWSADGVVTPKLLVKGTSHLRVVDASVLPYLPAAHPQACIYAVAERAADLIKADWS